MNYVDGFVIPVPNDKKEAYRTMCTEAAKVYMECGALSVTECWGDDVPDGRITDLKTAVKANPNESVVFSWIVWPSKEARDAGNRKVMEDPRMQPGPDMPFDGKRMIMGGFEVLLDTSQDSSFGFTPAMSAGQSVRPVL